MSEITENEAYNREWFAIGAGMGLGLVIAPVASFWISSVVLVPTGMMLGAVSIIGHGLYTTIIRNRKRA